MWLRLECLPEKLAEKHFLRHSFVPLPWDAQRRRIWPKNWHLVFGYHSLWAILQLQSLQDNKQGINSQHPNLRHILRWIDKSQQQWERSHQYIKWDSFTKKPKPFLLYIDWYVVSLPFHSLSCPSHPLFVVVLMYSFFHRVHTKNSQSTT